MTVAPRPRRRSRPTLLARLRRFWLLALVVVVLAGVGSFGLATAPAFELHDLGVTGLGRVSRNEVVARAAIDPRANVWLLDTHAIARRIEAIPYVATATVHRRPLANVWIEIAERTIDGCVRAEGGAVMTIDRSDRVLEGGCSPAATRTYELRGPAVAIPGHAIVDNELTTLQHDADTLASAGESDGAFRTFRHDRFGGLEADLPSGIRIRFGDDTDLDRKRKLIGPILAQLGGRAAGVRALDLRALAAPVAEFVPATPPPAQGSTHSRLHTQYTQGVHRVHHNM